MGWLSRPQSSSTRRPAKTPSRESFLTSEASSSKRTEAVDVEAAGASQLTDVVEHEPGNESETELGVLDCVAVVPESSTFSFTDIACRAGGTSIVQLTRTDDRSLWESFAAWGTERRAKKRKEILSNVSGYAKSGEVFAIMGASGAGKTTMLDVLARKISSARISGTVKLDGVQVTSNLMRRASAYVKQDDLMHTCLTVRETLRFAAELRLPDSLTKEDKVEKVETTLELLGLTKVANSLIGDEFRRGISGGERKRVAIGVEIIKDPRILFLDEPTSGLDSTSAYRVVAAVKDIARKSNSIAIMVLHQPSFRVLGEIDRLLLLACGRRIYFGPPSKLPDFFSAFGCPMPQHANSTEYALDLIEDFQKSETRITELVGFSNRWTDGDVAEDGEGVKGAETGENSEDPAAAAATSVALSPRRKQSQELGSMSRGASETVASPAWDAKEAPKFANTWQRELVVLMWRMVIILKRTPALYLLRLTLITVTGFLVACLFYHPPENFLGFQMRVAYFAFSLCVLFFVSADVVPLFIQERNIFIRETTHNSYRSSTYVVASTIVYMPLQVLSAVLLVLETWWIVGLTGGAGSFLFLCFALFGCLFVGSAIAVLVSVILNNIILSYTLAITLMAYFVLVCGFYIPRANIAPIWIWLHYLSPMKYAFEAMALNEFDRPDGPCFVRASDVFGMTPLKPYVTEEISDKAFRGLAMLLKDTPYSNLTSETCLQDGQVLVQNMFYMTQFSKWEAVAILFASGLFVRLLYFLVLVRFTRSKQK